MKIGRGGWGKDVFASRLVFFRSRPVLASRFFHLSGLAGAADFVEGEFGQNGYIHVGGQLRG